MSLQQVSVRIIENTHISEARRASARLAQELGFNDVSQEHLAIVVTELARNVMLHGGGGEIILQPNQEGGVWVDVLALDKGAGIADLSRALLDGYSTTGTPGTGFGAVSRFSSICEVYSKPGHGTAVLARVECGKSRRDAGPSSLGSVCVPIEGERRCGDAWEHQELPGKRMIIVADGLGHGIGAAEAAAEALEAFRANWRLKPKEIIEAAHNRLQKTRGAAVAVAEIDFERRVVSYAGIGNICGSIIAGGRSRSLISHNGIVGHQSERIHEFAVPWEPGGFLIMHSDGVNTRWNLENYPGLQNKPAALIAGVLYRDFKRWRDDATVVVTKELKAA